VKDVAAAGVPLTTTQSTSKRLKGQILVSALLFWGGLILWFGQLADAKPGVTPSLLPMFVMMVGIIWYLVTKSRIWWHHK
jgi:hypothetical protein